VLGLAANAVGKTLEGAGLFERIDALEDAIVSVRGGESRAVLTAAPVRGREDRAVNALVTPFEATGDAKDRGSVLVVAEDVTEELRTKARLIHTERLAAIGRMAAHVTHEVRNPLSSIGLNVELLEEELASAGAEAKDLLRAIHKEIERLTSITEEYLELARLPEPSLASEDLGALVREGAEFMRLELSAHAVTLDVQTAPGLPVVQLDEAQIRQVLLNLLKNAREAMPSGGTVELRVQSGHGEEGGVTLRVTDHGTGMTEEQRARIFDPFYTTKARGTGLGLPLSQQIVVAHGGVIRCDSEPGRGTTFEIWLPTERAQRPATPAQPSLAEGAE
jgi:signal transduction histidine kinase